MGIKRVLDHTQIKRITRRTVKHNNLTIYAAEMKDGEIISLRRSSKFHEFAKCGIRNHYYERDGKFWYQSILFSSFLYRSWGKYEQEFIDAEFEIEAVP